MIRMARTVRYTASYLKRSENQWVTHFCLDLPALKEADSGTRSCGHMELDYRPEIDVEAGVLDGLEVVEAD